MVRRGVVAFVVLAGGILAGCNLTVQGIDLTEYEDPAAYRLPLVAVVDGGCQGSPPPISARVALEMAFSEVRNKCEVFFDGITEQNRRGRYSRRALGDAALFTTALMTATTASAKAIGITAAGVILADQLIQDFAEVYGFQPYTYKIRELVQETMDDFRAASLSEQTFADGNSRDAYCIAYVRVRDYASLCTITSIQSRFDQLVASDASARPKQVVVAGAGGNVGGFGVSARTLSSARPANRAVSFPSTTYVVGRGR